MKSKNKKKVVYLGGFFNAERSMRQSFIENGIDITFPVEGNYRKYAEDCMFDCNLELFDVYWVDTAKKLKAYLAKERPSIVVHRYYRDDPFLHATAGEACRSLGIPYAVYRMETYPMGPIKPVECDLFLYAHWEDRNYIPFEVFNRSYFFPYGVSSVEKRMKIAKTYELASFGLGRFAQNDRLDNFTMYFNSVIRMRKELNVFWNRDDVHRFEAIFGPRIKSTVVELTNTGKIDDRGQILRYPQTKVITSYIIYNERFSIEEQEAYINGAKIIFNVDTVYKVPRIYSHKIFQSLGCGVPTITYYKEDIEEAFGNNWENMIYVSNSKEVDNAVWRLLGDDTLYNKIADNAYNYMHKRYNWYNTFDSIMKKDGIWK